MSDGALLDLVCGPASPLPETYQRYRLVAHLGSGGQADVYRAVRLCGGVSSAPMTVKVFRVDPCRPLVDELRSWDKGDAALMDLNNRGVGAICRRADGFYGPPPHRPGEPSQAGDAVPYQVYDYLHGVNLRQYVTQHAGTGTGGRRLNGVAALRTLAGVLRALHLPQEPGATPVLHMDVKPANVMVLTNGEVRLIDFTGARYWRPEEITQISFTPDSGGPEAFSGVREVGPGYDVHGFGAVAFFMVTGQSARVDPTGAAPSGPDRSVVRPHPGLDRAPALRDHLHAALADRPGDRPKTAELAGWVQQLGDLVRRAGLPDLGIDWGEPDRAETAKVVGRATPRPAVTGTETAAFQHIERLERELVELRATVVGGNGTAVMATPGVGRQAPARGAAAATQVGTPVLAAAMPGRPGERGNGGGAPGHGGAMPGHGGAVPGHGGAVPGHGGAVPGYGGPVAGPGGPVAGHGSAGLGRADAVPGPGGGQGGRDQAKAPTSGGAQPMGRARVPEPKGRNTDEQTGNQIDSPVPDLWDTPTRADIEVLKRGWRLSGFPALFAFVCWGIWAASSGGKLSIPLIMFVVVLAVAIGVFFLTRLIGRLVLEQRLGRVRHSAAGAHVVAGLFLLAAGVAYLQQVGWVRSFSGWLGSLFS